MIAKTHIPSSVATYLVGIALLYTSLAGSYSATAQKTLTYENRVYESRIKTVQLYAFIGSGDGGMHAPAAIALAQQPGLRLEFDDLSGNVENYYAKIIHCTYKWEPSTLSNLDFLKTYNEFPVNNYVFSSGVQMPYVHYRFEAPRVELPGNYLLVVYRGNPDDVILSRRFMIYQPLTALSTVDQRNRLTLCTSCQELYFYIDYQKAAIPDPYISTHVVIRQNQRWDNAKWDITPSAIKETQQRLEYLLPNNEESRFWGGNEFRSVDFRSLIAPGRHTDYIDRSTTPEHLWVQVDKSKAYQAYAQYEDMNGGYSIANLDRGNPASTAEYVQATFRLASPPLSDAHVYVVGAFNGWRKGPRNKMRYHSDKGQYRYTDLLKQGQYDYSYAVEGSNYPPYHIDGSHFETQNQYEVLIYQRSFQRQADLLIGYFTVSVNPR